MIVSSAVDVVVASETMISVYEEVEVEVEKTISSDSVTVETVGDPNDEVQAANWARGLPSARPMTCWRQGLSEQTGL